MVVGSADESDFASEGEGARHQVVGVGSSANSDFGHQMVVVGTWLHSFKNCIKCTLQAFLFCFGQLQDKETIKGVRSQVGVKKYLRNRIYLSGFNDTS